MALAREKAHYIKYSNFYLFLFCFVRAAIRLYVRLFQKTNFEINRESSQIQARQEE